MKTDLQIEIGKRLRSMRLELDFSQQTIANILGITYSGYSAMEHGNTNITTERLYQLCAIFRCEVTDILPPAKEYKPRLKYVKHVRAPHPTHLNSNK